MRHRFTVWFGSAGLTLLCFLVLPLLQAIARKDEKVLHLTEVDTYIPPPEEPPPPEPEQEPEPEEKPPEMQEQLAPLDLSQLELALNPTLSGGWLAGDFGINLDSLTKSNTATEDMFSELDLDQKPRVVFDTPPVLTPTLRRKRPATVTLLFDVTPEGRVENPTVFDSTDSAFETAALQAIRQWRFEPGKRNNEPVRFRMRLPMRFRK
ncbi:MAG: energy transducer TonB [Planctomycetes bacterium]|nr:energy transducer TonB [Planctomycetota bacterium]